MLPDAPAISFQMELLEDIQGELEALAPAHWREVTRPALQPHLPLHIHWEVYAALEQSGQLRLLTVRVDDALVGYATALLYEHLHSQGVFCASINNYYIDPAYREGGLGLQLLAAMRESLRDDGVQYLTIGTKAHRSLAPLLERLGMVCEELIYSQWVGE